jgi:hypothetical protein
VEVNCAGRSPGKTRIENGQEKSSRDRAEDVEDGRKESGGPSTSLRISAALRRGVTARWLPEVEPKPFRL